MDNSAKGTQASPQKDLKKDSKGRPRRGRTVHIRDIFLLLWDKKLLILLFLVAVVSVTVVYTWKSPKLYKATARLVIEKETLTVLPPSKNVLAVDTSTTDYYNTQYRILRTRTLAQNVINVLRLKVRSPSGADRPMHYSELLRKIIVSPLRETRLVDVSIVDRNPLQAAEIANTVAQEFIKLNVTSNLEARRAAARAIREQLEEVSSQVQEAERRFNDFKTRYNIVSIDEKQNLIYKDMTLLTDAASQARSEMSAAEAAYNRIKDIPLEELKRQPEVTNDSVIQRLEADYVAAQRILHTLSGRYGSRHPRILDQKALVAGIAEDIDARAESIREVLRNAWLAGKQKEEKAIQAVEEAKKRFHEFDAVAAEFRKLQMEVDNNKTTYGELLRRSVESVVETQLTRAPSEWEQGTSNIRLIDRAVPPGAPFRPRPLVNMALAVFVGLALGCGCAFLIVYLDDKVRNPDDVTEDLGRTLLGEIPVVKGRLAAQREKGRIVYDHPDSALSEAYRNLRASIDLLAKDGIFPSILVTSACHGEGKTTAAANLAITIAQAGRRVLLVDTDMRRPRMHRHFGIDESRGLVRYFSGEATLDDSLVDKSDLARHSAIPADRADHLEQGELWVLPCGERRVYNPTELIGSRRMEQLIADLKNRFDVLIFDSPPCRFSDPLILARLVEGVLVVVEAGKFPKSLIAQGLENLDKIEGNKLLGIVLNKYDPKKSGSYGYYGYRSYYYHRYYDRYYYSHRYPAQAGRGGLWQRLLYKPSPKRTAKPRQQAPSSSVPSDRAPKKGA